MVVAVINARQLVTLAGPARPRVGAEMSELDIRINTGMLIEDGYIVHLDPSEVIAAEAEAMGAEVVDAAGKVVMPGWVDAHTHAIFGGNRVDEYEMRARGATYEEIAAAGGGIRSTVAKTRAASEDELVEVGRKHAWWFLKGGTTTIEAKSGYGLTVEDELKILRALHHIDRTTPLSVEPTFLGAHAFPAEYADDREGYVSLVVDEMLPLVAEGGLARWCDIFVEKGYFTANQARRVLRAAREHGLGLRMHVDQLTNGGGAALAAEVGAATADHLEQTDSAGIATLKDASVQPVLLPASVYGLGLSKYPPAREMIDAGLPVVLASDFNPGSSPTPSMPMVLSLACTHMKMSPAEAVTAATVNAAYSLGLSDRGSFEPGSRGDFVVYDCDDYREIPYFFGVDHVEATYVKGQKVFDDLMITLG